MTKEELAVYGYKEETDLLRDVPGDTPEERREFLQTLQVPSQEKVDKQLVKAITARSAECVRDLLGLDVSNTPLPEDKRPAVVADPNLRPETGKPVLHQAAQALCLGVVEALVAAGADGRALHVGRTALELAVRAGATAPTALQDELQEKVAAIVEACAQAQYGMPYAATLTVGTAVTWTQRPGERPGKITEERLGTIVEVEDASPDSLRKGDRKCVVEWASTGRKAGTFSAASLHLPTTEQMEKIRQVTEARA